MVNWILKKMIGSKNTREIKRLRPIVDEINRIEQELQSLNDDVLRAKTATWKAHLATVNDYLARRDAEWMGELFKFLGLTVGCIQHDQPPHVRREQYACDICYGTNSEFGFDYLRDNGMATSKEQQVQRGYHFAIVDEVDSILIDEARTPLIISGPATVSTHQYDKFKPLVEQLVRKQTKLCNRLASEADELFQQGKTEEAGRIMFKVKLGQPRNKGLLRFMEEPE